MKCKRCGINELTSGDYDQICTACRLCEMNLKKVESKPLMTGWQCPVCKKVHAIWVNGCDCHIRISQSGSTYTKPNY